MSSAMWTLLGGLAIAASLMASEAWGQTSPSDFTSGTRYDAARRVVGTIAPDPDGAGSLHFAATRSSYDALGRLTRQEKGELSSWQDQSVAPSAWAGFTTFTQVDTTYDTMDRKLTDTVSGRDPLGTMVVEGLTQYSYDAYGRLECTASRMNPAAYGSLPSSACTLGTAGSYGPDRIARTVYDAGGQVLKVQKAYGVTTANGFAQTLQQDYAAYTYSDNGKPLSMTDAGGNKASMGYDGFDRQVQWNMPSKTTPGTVSTTDYEAYTYDDAGNRLTLSKRDGSTIGYSYDALNRVTEKDIPGGTAADVYYGYDLRGLQLYARFVSSTGVGITNSYDGFSRLITTANDMSGTAKTLSYQWDADGNRIRITHPDSVYFTYEYDGLDRTTAIKENGTTTIVSDNYDNQGRRSSETRGGVTTAYTYDPVSRLASLSDDLASTTNDVTSTFSYSPASQILTKTRSNDLYAFNGYVTLSRTYAANGLNQYDTAGAATFTYDANGNLTGDGTNSYTYDVENRMLTGSGPTAATLQYDPLGRLWRMVLAADTIEYVYDGDALVVEYATGGIGSRYVQGNGEDDPLVLYRGSTLATLRSLQADVQGSIVSIADSSGGTYAINSYDEYGIPASGNLGRFQYTGQMWIGQLGMYYYKARMYSPTLGRFMQTDPIGYADQADLYTYVGNDPVDGRDPSGQCIDRSADTPAICNTEEYSYQRAPPQTSDRKKDKERAQGHEGASVIGYIGVARDLILAQAERLGVKSGNMHFARGLRFTRAGGLLMTGLATGLTIQAYIKEGHSTRAAVLGGLASNVGPFTIVLAIAGTVIEPGGGTAVGIAVGSFLDNFSGASDATADTSISMFEYFESGQAGKDFNTFVDRTTRMIALPSASRDH